MRRVVSVWFPSLSTDRLRRRPGAPPADAPFVTYAHDGRRQILAAADPVAVALDLLPGLPLAEARARIPGLAAVEADAEADAAALRDLAAWALRWTPLVAPDPPDGLLLDMTGASDLHGGEAAMLADLLRRLGNAGLQARAAMAGTMGAARALARGSSHTPVLVPPGGEREALAGLPIAALGVEPSKASGLRGLGLERVGDLLALPRAPLARRFGAGLLDRLDRALGHLPDPLQPWTPPGRVEHRLDMVEPLLTAEGLGIGVERLLAAVCPALERRGEGARVLDLLFHRVDGSVRAVRIGTARASRDPRHLGRMLRARLEEVEPGFGVEAMCLIVRQAEPLTPVQASAANTGPGEADIAALVDRLAPIARVFRAAPVESRVPERAVRRASPLWNDHTAAWPAGLPRPARLLAPPQPVEAISALPDRPPAAFTWGRVRRRIRRADGPERIAGEWWLRDSEARAVRDYWRVEDEAGRRYWLFRRGDGEDPVTGDLRWFLHGLF